MTNPMKFLLIGSMILEFFLMGAVILVGYFLLLDKEDRDINE
jgi:hypothetical protein